MRIVALDLIRFFAALSVVLYHYISRPESNAYPALSEVTEFGYLGVPLFFMISGYVISLSANHRRSALQFGVSRFVRLYPALWAGIIFTSLTLVIFTEKQYSIWQILANFTLLGDYFGFEDVDGVYWTLKAELKFYACVFLLLLFGVFQEHRTWLTIWLGLTALHAICSQPFFMGWFITPGYSSFFIAGVACFLIQKEGKNRYNITVLLASFVISSYKAFIQTEGFIIEPSTVDKSIAMIIVWSFFALMYLLCIGKINLTGRKSYITIGALTYPLYLVHNMAGKAIIDHYSNIVPERLMILIVIGLMIVVSLLIYIGVEKQAASPLKMFLMSKLAGVKR